ncbi:MAG: hypothetical protein U0470_14865, partial [Anaerolineae bacterium]
MMPNRHARPRAAARLAALIAAVAALSPALLSARAGALRTAAPPTHYAFEAAWAWPERPILPVDVALIDDGRIIVADGRNARLLVVDGDGAVEASWPTAAPPVALAVDGAAGRVYALSMAQRRERSGRDVLVRTDEFVEVWTLDGRRLRQDRLPGWSTASSAEAP